MKIDHRNNFDLIRLLAATDVLFSHMRIWLEVPLPKPVAYAVSFFPGVAVFFIVSGFLIPGSFMSSRNSLRQYFLNRALRIYPALWVNLAVILLALLVSGSLRLFPSDMAFWPWIAIAFSSGCDWVASYFVGPISQSGFYRYFPSGVLWTIPVELSFYLLVPILFNRRLTGLPIYPAFLFGFAAISLAIWARWPIHGYPYQIGSYLWIFLLGAALRLFWNKAHHFMARRAFIWLPLYIAAFAAAFHYGQPYSYQAPSALNAVLTLLLAVAVISSAYTAPKLTAILRGRDLSYGVYLWHMPVIWTFVGFSPVGNWLYAGLATVLAFTFALASWTSIERPALALKNRARWGRATVITLRWSRLMRQFGGSAKVDRVGFYAANCSIISAVA